MMISRLCQVVFLTVALSLSGCAVETYQVGERANLSANDAAIAYVRQNLLEVTNDGVKLDRPVRPLSVVMPAYPRPLLLEKISGASRVRFTVDMKGGVRDAMVVTQTNRAFGQVVLDAVKQWRFAPITIGGEPRACVFEIPFVFQATD